MANHTLKKDLVAGQTRLRLTPLGKQKLFGKIDLSGNREIVYRGPVKGQYEDQVPLVYANGYPVPATYVSDEQGHPIYEWSRQKSPGIRMRPAHTLSAGHFILSLFHLFRYFML